MRKKKFLLLPFVILILIVTVKSKSIFNHNEKKIEKDSLVTISISAVGDLMCHSPQFDYARVTADSFNFNPEFDSIKPYLKKTDFLFGNLETVTAGKSFKYSGYPAFNSPDDFIRAIKASSFTMLITSNNHALDRGANGALRTISVIKNSGLDYDGTFTSESDRDSIRIFDLKGIKVAFLAYTYGVNGNYIPKGKSYLINLIDTTLIKEDIISARKIGADIVLVYFHFGTQYKRTPDEFQKQIVDKTIQYGADIIIGSHPHVIEPAEFFKTNNAKLDTGFVAYSLGNFVSNQRWRYADAGMILKIFLSKNIRTDSIFINKVTYLPTWVFKGKINNKDEFNILPAQEAFEQSCPSFLSDEDKRKMEQAFDDTRETMTKYSGKLRIENIQR